MQKIKVGMTRADLLKVFTTEGGLSTSLNRTFVYRDCSYIKVDVEFEAVGRPARDADGRVNPIEANEDDKENIQAVLGMDGHRLMLLIIGAWPVSGTGGLTSCCT
jgi:hypothetical protein